MNSDEQLMIEAVVVGLRRSGSIDRQTVKCIAETLLEAATVVEEHREGSAKRLRDLAVALTDGPARSCVVFGSARKS